VPTTLKRHYLTEVPALRDALRVARATWPEEKSDTRLIYHLVAAGAEHLREAPEAATAARLALAQELAGQHPSQLGTDYLNDLRREWDR
jgi:hypothetical protein